ncbi:hypothetical protein H0G86_001202 [Trichoderma simmonsii]|uniref:Transmembrane protein n=1 Tax=Trichoderma simmonsii TaxID=1491479 RepID=A0A8G0L150_9HYPO|nr:hypothetical protein H0G86_001202 [Trichoderma simmonsii]
MCTPPSSPPSCRLLHSVSAAACKARFFGYDRCMYLLPARTLLDAHTRKYLFVLVLVHAVLVAPANVPVNFLTALVSQLSLRFLFSLLHVYSFLSVNLGPMEAVRKGKPTIFFFPRLTHVGQSTAGHAGPSLEIHAGVPLFAFPSKAICCLSM